MLIELRIQDYAVTFSVTSDSGSLAALQFDRLSLEESLVGALNQMAEQFADRGVFGQRLMAHVQSKAAISPEDVLKGLAADFHSEQLREALTRLTLAREGGMSYVEALALSVEAVEHEIRVHRAR